MFGKKGWICAEYNNYNYENELNVIDVEY